MLPIASFNEWAEENELEIIPRDPETYNDWKVGDVIKCKNSDTKRIIISRIGETIFISDLFGNYIQEISTTKSIAQNYKLVLTDYEQELLAAKRKKEGWMNIYKSSASLGGGASGIGIYTKEEDAVAMGKLNPNYISTIKIEWEE